MLAMDSLILSAINTCSIFIMSFKTKDGQNSKAKKY